MGNWAWQNNIEPPFEDMPDPQFNTECPSCECKDSIIEHSTGNWRWRVCGHCGECEGVHESRITG